MKWRNRRIDADILISERNTLPFLKANDMPEACTRSTSCSSAYLAAFRAWSLINAMDNLSAISGIRKRASPRSADAFPETRDKNYPTSLEYFNCPPPPPQKKKNQTRSFYLLPRSKKTSQEPRPHRENRFGFCCRERNENKEKKNLSFSQRGRLRRKKRGGMVSRISVSGKAIKPGIWMD